MTKQTAPAPVTLNGLFEHFCRTRCIYACLIAPQTAPAPPRPHGMNFGSVCRIGFFCPAASSLIGFAERPRCRLLPQRRAFDFAPQPRTPIVFPFGEGLVCLIVPPTAPLDRRRLQASAPPTSISLSMVCVAVLGPGAGAAWRCSWFVRGACQGPAPQRASSIVCLWGRRLSVAAVWGVGLHATLPAVVNGFSSDPSYLFQSALQARTGVSGESAREPRLLLACHRRGRDV